MLFLWVLALITPCFGNIEENLISSQEHPLSQTIPLEGWIDDFSKAQKLAQEANKPLLIAFLGPNWCPWSDQLEAEVLAQPSFLNRVKKEAVLVKVDIPEEYQATENSPNLVLKENFHIEECPSLVLVEPSGHLIAKLRYLPITTDEFASHIHEILQDYERISHLPQGQKLGVEEVKSLYVKAGRLADETFKKSLLKQGLRIDRSPYFLLEQYKNMLSSAKLKDPKLVRIRNKIIARDRKNQSGFRRKLALMDFQTLAHAVQKPQKSDRVIQPLVEYLQKFGKRDPENAWRLEMMISQYLFGHNKTQEALKHARASYAIAPDSAKDEISQSIDYLKTHLP